MILLSVIDLVRDCGDRVFGIENRISEEKDNEEKKARRLIQSDAILQAAIDLLNKNDGQYYHHPLIDKCLQKIQNDPNFRDKDIDEIKEQVKGGASVDRIAGDRELHRAAQKIKLGGAGRESASGGIKVDQKSSSSGGGGRCCVVM